MSFWKSLFGGGEKQSAAPGVDAREEHEGYTIAVALIRVDGEYQIAGSIEKEIAGDLKVHSFIRADKFSNRDDAIAATLGKGRQLIKEQGSALFS